MCWRRLSPVTRSPITRAKARPMCFNGEREREKERDTIVYICIYIYNVTNVYLLLSNHDKHS